jgi:hypothetical protein
MKQRLIAMICLVSLAACSDAPTRSKVHDLIVKGHHYDTPMSLPLMLAPEEIAEGIKRGFWTNDALTPLGEKYFVIDRACHCMRLMKVQPKIEVTGITGEGNTRTVEYIVRWFDGQPEDIRVLFKDREIDRQSDFIRCYDDGWRIVIYVQ